MDKTLLIVGGGFAGTRAAQVLERTLPPDWTLTLISQENFITFNPLLPEVVGASILPSHVIAPHRQMIHCSHVCMAQVTEIDTAARVVHYLGEGAGTMPYDQLILACGTNANLDVVRGMGNYGLPLKTLGDAMFLRNRIIARLEQAELQPDPEHRRWLTSFIVVGGGFSGVETAGELVDFLYASLRYYRRIGCEDLRICLLHGTDRLLPELSPRLGAFTLRKMRSRRIDVRLNARAVRVTDRDVHLESGEIIAGGEHRLQAQGTTHPPVPLPSERSTLLGGPQQGGGRNLRRKDLRLRGVAHVARVLPAAHSNTGAQVTTVPGVELGDVLSTRRRAPRLPPDAAAQAGERAVHTRERRSGLGC